MSTATKAFTSDDAALACRKMTDEVTADIDYVNQRQYDAEFSKAEAEVRTLLGQVMRLHGVSAFGDADEGDEQAADAILREARDYQADPAAYIANLDLDVQEVEESAAEAETPVQTHIPAPVTITAPVPVAAFETMAQPADLAVPEARLKIVDRPASTLFQGISSSYATELVPTMKWETPKPEIPERDKHYSFNGFAVKVMASAIRRRKNVMAVGDPGCGKTEFFKQFGYAVGLPVHKIPFDGTLSRGDLIGSFRQVATPTGSATPFVLGLLPRLIQEPGILVLDEIDQADPDLHYILHPLYEGEGLYIQENGGQFIPRHPHCYIVATANTKGRGSDNGLTHARHEMSEATRDRFQYWLNFTYLPAEKEAATINAKTDLDLALCAKLVSVAAAIRESYNKGTAAQPCSFRQLQEVAEIAHDFMFSGPDVALALACETVLIGRANQEDASGITEFVRLNVGVDLNTLER